MARFNPLPGFVWGKDALNSAATKRSRWLHGYAVFVACMTFLLIFAGALVTSNDAGLSVPDWPTSFGSFKIPKMVGGVMFEDGHRMIAGAVAALTLILALALWAKEDRRWVKWLGWAAVLAVVVQAILGGLGVIYYLPAFFTVAHSCAAELYFAIMVSLAIFTSPKWRWDETKINDPLKPSLESLAVATSVIIFIQILLGAASRDNGMSVMPHIAFAAVVLAAVLYLLLRVLRLPGRETRLMLPAIALMILLIIQIFLGAGDYVMLMVASNAPEPVTPVVIATVMHVATGALVFATSIAVTYQIYRFVSPSAAPVRAVPQKPAVAGS